MARFIELTPKETGEAILINTDIILNVLPSQDGGCELLCNIAFSKLSKGCAVHSMEVRECYNLVRKLLIP